MSMSHEATTLGIVLLKMGCITQQQVTESVLLQRGRPGVQLGEIMVESGFITRRQLEVGLEFQERMRCGDKVNVMVDIITYKTRKAHQALTVAA